MGGKVRVGQQMAELVGQLGYPADALIVLYF